MYDGHRIQNWGDVSGQKAKRELFEQKNRSPSSSPFQYKNARYVKDITESMHDPYYMDCWLNDKQVRYKMMYKTLHFLARSGIDPSNFAKAAGSFSDSVKKRVIRRAKETAVVIKHPYWGKLGVQKALPSVKTIVYKENTIELVRYMSLVFLGVRCERYKEEYH